MFDMSDDIWPGYWRNSLPARWSLRHERKAPLADGIAKGVLRGLA